MTLIGSKKERHARYAIGFSLELNETGRTWLRMHMKVYEGGRHSPVKQQDFFVEDWSFPIRTCLS